MKRMRGDRRGFALMAALWLVVLVGVTGYELSVRSRSHRLAIANALEGSLASAAADAGIETARAALELRLASPLPNRTRSADDARFDPLGDLPGAADTIALGDERVAIHMYDASARIQINRASEDDMRRFLTALPMDAADAGRLAQRILDWRDADDSRRSQGAERDDYLRAGARTLPANADFQNVRELLNVEGMTDSLLARLIPLVALSGGGLVNVNTASVEVLRSIAGMSGDVLARIQTARRDRRLLRSLADLSPTDCRSGSVNSCALEGDLASRLIFDTREVAVESTGWVSGSAVRATSAVFYQRSGDALISIVRTRRQ